MADHCRTGDGGDEAEALTLRCLWERAPQPDPPHRQAVPADEHHSRFGPDLTPLMPAKARAMQEHSDGAAERQAGTFEGKHRFSAGGDTMVNMRVSTSALCPVGKSTTPCST